MVGGASWFVEVVVTLELAADADPDDVERLGRQLRDELRELDVESVTATAGPAAPGGSKGVDAAMVTEWVVTLGASGGAFALVVGTVRDWLTRRRGAHKVTVTIDGDTLELEAASPEERAELVTAFVRRHEPR